MIATSRGAVVVMAAGLMLVAALLDDHGRRAWGLTGASAFVLFGLLELMASRQRASRTRAWGVASVTAALIPALALDPFARLDDVAVQILVKLLFVVGLPMAWWMLLPDDRAAADFGEEVHG